MTIGEGDKFPSFHLPDQSGKEWSMDELAGRFAVLFFYPKDDTPGWTTEAGQFQSQLSEFGSTIVLGVSADSVKSHQKFAKKAGLQMPLLSDESKELCQACGVWVEKSMYGKKYWGIERSTFLIGPDGIIMRAWKKVVADGHATEVLASLNSIAH